MLKTGDRIAFVGRKGKRLKVVQATVTKVRGYTVYTDLPAYEYISARYVLPDTEDNRKRLQASIAAQLH